MKARVRELVQQGTMRKKSKNKKTKEGGRNKHKTTY